jgi:adenylate cyclase
LTEVRQFLGVKKDVDLSAAQDVHTILFTDIEGSTELTHELGDKASRALFREHERIVRDALNAHGGSEVKTMGDGFMAAFHSPTRAVECAVAIQEGITHQEVNTPFKVRIGLNSGEPIVEEGDFFGSTVILASRLASKAVGGEILVSDVVRHLVAGKGFEFLDRGSAQLKGFAEPVHFFEVHWRRAA